MTDINNLTEDELNDFNAPTIEVEEVGLEDLIVLGEAKKIPIHIIYPNDDGTRTKAKALVKQLTLQEMDNLNIAGKNMFGVNKIVLRKALFKQNGENFTVQEINVLPIGVVNAVGNKILELSGVDFNQRELMDF